MNTIINNKNGRRSAAWTGLLVLSLLAAIVLVAPTGVFAQFTVKLDQNCEYAFVGNMHTVTATITEGSVPGGIMVYFYSSPYYGDAVFDDNGVANFEYTAPSVDPITITLYAWDPTNFNLTILGTITTNWTDDEAKLCSDAPSVTVGGKVTLNAKKNGTFRIALCSVDGLEVKDVELDSVELVGVKPWQSKYKDSRLCPDGKDGVKDLVFKFKNREVVEALEKSNAEELEDEKPVDLTLTFRLNGKSLNGTWSATIKKEGKMHWKKSHSNKNDENSKGPKK